MKSNLKSQVLMYVSYGEMHCFLPGAIVLDCPVDCNIYIQIIV